MMMSSDVVLLVHVDLSAAFDAGDRNALFSRFKDMFGPSGRVLESCQTYLKQCFREYLFIVFCLMLGMPMTHHSLSLSIYLSLYIYIYIYIYITVS